MYNENQKQGFLRALSPDWQKICSAIFQKTEISERAAGHDLCEFMYQEFVNMFEACQYTESNTFYTNYTFIRKYVEYCCNHKLCDPNSLVELKRVKYSKDIKGYSKLRNEFFFDLDDMLKVIEYVFSKSLVDVTYYRPLQAYLGLIWIGLLDEEIYTLKPEDFSYFGLNIRGQCIEVPGNLKKIIKKMSEDEYFITTDGKARHYNIESQYLFKTSKSAAPITKGWYTDKCKQWKKCANDLPITDELYGKKLDTKSIKKSALYSEIYCTFFGEISDCDEARFNEFISDKMEGKIKEVSMGAVAKKLMQGYNNWIAYYRYIKNYG